MAPGPDGSLYVSIPRPGGSILTLLGEDGRSRPGWPVVVRDSTACGHLLPVQDGSVRTVCDATDLPQPELDTADVRAFGFDPGGRMMAGWPVQLRPGMARVVDDELRILSTQYLSDVVETGKVSHEVWLEAVATDGTVRNGRRVPMLETCCGESWTIGPDGVAYGRVPVEPRANTGAPQATQLTAVDLEGVVAGWPLQVDGAASAPAFDPGRNIHLTVGSYTETTTHVEVLEPGGLTVARSSELPIATAEWAVDGGAEPARPLLAADGTAFVYSDVGAGTMVYAIYAMTGAGGSGTGLAGEVMPGWPYRPPMRLVRPGYCEPGTICAHEPAVPALGPGNVLYLPLQARSESVGGSLVAVGSDTRVPSGWPVELQRPGAEFWSVVVGPDGTAYALAIEPEAANTSSATILAIAPDSSVLYHTTLAEP